MKSKFIFLVFALVVAPSISLAVPQNQSDDEEHLACCEKEIGQILSVVGSDLPANSKFVVLVDRDERSKHDIYAGCVRYEKVVGCEIHISDRLFKTYAKKEKYSVLAHEVCHVLEEKFETVDGEGDENESEFFADKCSLGIIMRLGIDPRIALITLVKTRDNLSPFISKEDIASIEARISRIEKEIEEIKRLKKETK